VRRINACLVLLQVLIGFGAPQASGAAPAPPSVAFYYSGDLPAASLSHFDHVVVQADQVDFASVDFLHRRGITVFAYLSISEVSRKQVQTLDERWRLGDDIEWNTVVMDASQPGWQKLFLDKYVRPLWERGFRAIFLDNLDSYQRAVKTSEGRARQIAGLVRIIKELHVRFPGIKLLFNRGFELLPEVAPLCVGVIAESLFRGWDPIKKAYVEVSEEDRKWLKNELVTARDRYHLPVTVIDYVPPGQRELARATARRIAELGMTPWVTDWSLTGIGVGAVEVIPRRILALYNSVEQRDRGTYADLAYSRIHLSGAVVLEHLGYAVDYVDVAGPLPAGPLSDRYAGIVTWFSEDRVPSEDSYRSWLLQQIESGMKVAILDHLGFAPDLRLQQRLGIVYEERGARGEVRLVAADPVLTGFETKVAARQNVFFLLALQDPAARRLLSVEDGSGSRMDAVFTTWWGGLAAGPYVCQKGHAESLRWLINPFLFFKQALKLPDLPAPDVTTLDGRRMLIVHIDGDGFPSRAQMPGNDYSGKVILEQILKRYRIKTTVSVIEGEIGPAGKWPKLSPELEAIAREIFALPHVEVASHSYSHPFDWLRQGQDMEDGEINGLFRYDFSLQREIKDSVVYINQRLTSSDKPVKVFLWSGAAIAPAEALAQAESAGVLNMNGGNTIISDRQPTLTVVSAMGRPLGRYYQVYAPIQNENVFTNLWRGPSYGFREVISTFQLTGSPRRLKPINIYFHFYSGSKVGSLKALKMAYDWALSQDVIPVYASEYIRKVTDFQRLTLARRLDGCWQVRGDGHLTTLRTELAMGEVDTIRSRGVTSVRDLPQGRYVGLDTSGRALLCTRSSATSSLASAPKER